jgi:hypothetical protein
MKALIYIGLAVGSTLGGLIGSWIDGGNIFGLWGLLLGTVGAFVGIWVGYKLSQTY